MKTDNRKGKWIYIFFVLNKHNWLTNKEMRENYSKHFLSQQDLSYRLMELREAGEVESRGTSPSVGI
jgi:hypothetical protein